MTQTDIAVVRTFLEAVIGGDIDTALAQLTDDVEVVEMGSIPHSGTYRGRQGFSDLMARFGELYGGFEITDISVHDAGEFIVARMLGTFLSKAGDSTITMPITEHYWMNGGRMAKADVYYKDPDQFRQLQYQEPAGSAISTR
jgi:ketosteroid isomerase-like protein